MCGVSSIQFFRDTQSGPLTVAGEEDGVVWKDEELLRDAPEDLLRGLNPPRFSRRLGVERIPGEEEVANEKAY